MIRCRPHIRFPSLLAGLALVSTQMLLGFDGMRDAPLSPSYVQAEPTVMEQAPILLVNYCAGCHQAGRSGKVASARLLGDRGRLARPASGTKRARRQKEERSAERSAGMLA